jgi:hypothetical protein
MAIVGAYTIIRALALFHITLGIYFLHNPKMVAEQNIVFLMGEAMQLVSLAPARPVRLLTSVAHAPRLLQTLGNQRLHRRPPRLPRHQRPHLALPLRRARRDILWHPDTSPADLPLRPYWLLVSVQGRRRLCEQRAGIHGQCGRPSEKQHCLHLGVHRDGCVVLGERPHSIVHGR